MIADSTALLCRAQTSFTRIGAVERAFAKRPDDAPGRLILLDQLEELRAEAREQTIAACRGLPLVAANDRRVRPAMASNEDNMLVPVEFRP